MMKWLIEEVVSTSRLPDIGAGDDTSEWAPTIINIFQHKSEHLILSTFYKDVIEKTTFMK